MPTENSSEQFPLVSVICRTIGRPELQQAVQSLQSQSYPNVQLVLVDAAGQGIALPKEQCNNLSLKTVSTGNKLSRSQAANTGLENSDGEYLMFLDDDDWVASEHIESLTNYLEEQESIKAAYSSTQTTDSSGNASDYIFDRDFDPLLLMRDNYIPIHSVIFHRSLLEQGCSFDNNFDIYEDWDFWLQVSRHTSFHHLPLISAFYREGGDSQTASAGEFDRFEDDNIQGKARAAILNKWINVWQGSEVNALIGSLYKERVTEVRQLNSEIVNRDELLRKSGKQLEAAQTALSGAQAALNREKNSNAQLSEEIIELTAHVGRVEEAHRMIEDSVFWKMTAPLRSIRDRFWEKSSDTDSTETAVERKPANTPGTSGSQNFKDDHDKDAKKLLHSFLDSQQQLTFPKADKPSVSIILVLFNQAHLSLCCIKSILQQVKTSYELIIADNNSQDESAELLTRLENVKTISNDDNLGFVKAVNQGAALATGDNILLLNNDAVLEPKALENALDTLQSDSGIGAVGAKIKFLDGKLQEAGSIIWSDGYCLGYGRNEAADNAEFNYFRDVDYCSGAFLLFSRADFEALQGFDEQFSPAYYEESDFCIRLRQSGKRIVYCPDAQITHYEFASTGGFDSASELQIAHRQLLLEKHGEFLSSQKQKNPENILAARTANDFPNVLIIDDRIPYPYLGAGYPRCNYLLEKLSKFPLNLGFYPLQFPHDDWGILYNAVPTNVEVMLNRGLGGLKDFLLDRKDFYDFVMVSRIHNMEYLDKLMASTPDLLGSARLIYDAEAVTSPREILKRRVLGEMVDEAEAEDKLKDEIKSSREAERIVVVSANEAEIYREHGYSNTVVLGHALPSSPSPKTFDQRNGMLFVGALRDEGSPNVDSLLWFVINVLPIIQEEIPDIVLNVVGGNSATSLATIDRPNVRFTGELDTLENVYNDNRIFIAPTRFAAGIPHKIHEASANGIPTVATDLLTKQLSWTHGKEILSADSAQKFAEQCIELYSKEDLWNKIKNSSLAAVEKDCSEVIFHETLSSLFDINT